MRFKLEHRYENWWKKYHRACVMTRSMENFNVGWQYFGLSLENRDQVKINQSVGGLSNSNRVMINQSINQPTIKLQSSGLPLPSPSDPIRKVHADSRPRVVPQSRFIPGRRRESSPDRRCHNPKWSRLRVEKNGKGVARLPNVWYFDRIHIESFRCCFWNKKHIVFNPPLSFCCQLRFIKIELASFHLRGGIMISSLKSMEASRLSSIACGADGERAMARWLFTTSRSPAAAPWPIALGDEKLVLSLRTGLIFPFLRARRTGLLGRRRILRPRFGTT